MTGILMLESLTRGNTLKQGDKTPLTYKLLDADGDNLNIAGKTATARLVHPNYLTIGYEKSGLTVSQDDTVTFTIDKLIPARKYNVEIIVDNKFVFPSRSTESKFTIDKSSLGNDARIIEIIGKEALIRTVKTQVDTELQPLITSMESAQQAELERVQAENERSVKYESYAQQFNDVITDLSEEKDYHSLPEISAARGGYDTLGQRLDETTAQLAQTVTLINPSMTTEEIQTLLNTNKHFKFLSGVYHLEFTTELRGSPICLTIPPNINVICEDDVIFKIPSNNHERYTGLLLSEVENIHWYGGTIVGDRDTHEGSTGEWGHGVRISGSKNVTFEKTTCRDCWGDGFIVSRGTHTADKDLDTSNYVWFSENINLIDCISDNNRRQGLSIISVKNMHVLRGEYKNTNGTLPMAGIDIEPDPNPNDYNSDVALGPIIQGLVIENVVTSGNERNGIAIDLRNYAGRNRLCDIKIINHTDDGSRYGLKCLGLIENGGYGNITISNPVWKNNTYGGFMVEDWSSESPKITVEKPTVIDHNTSNKSSQAYNSAYIVLKERTSMLVSGGNVTIIEPSIFMLGSQKPLRAFFIEDRTEGLLKDVNIINPLNVFGLQSWIYTSGNVEDRYGELMINTGNNSRTIIPTTYGRTYKNIGATGNKTLTLSHLIPVGSPEITFENTVDHTLILTPPEGVAIQPIGAVGERIHSDVKGSKITIRRDSENSFTITNMIGNWYTLE